MLYLDKIVHDMQYSHYIYAALTLSCTKNVTAGEANYCFLPNFLHGSYHTPYAHDIIFNIYKAGMAVKADITVSYFVLKVTPFHLKVYDLCIRDIDIEKMLSTST